MKLKDYIFKTNLLNINVIIIDNTKCYEEDRIWDQPIVIDKDNKGNTIYHGLYVTRPEREENENLIKVYGNREILDIEKSGNLIITIGEEK